MYLLFDICNQSSFLIVFLILKYAFSIICTIIPLILIYRCLVPLFKAVTSGKEFSGEIGPIVKSLIAGLIIFLLPSVFSFVFVDLTGEANGLSQCFVNANIDTINSLRQSELDALKNENDKKKEDLNQAAIDREELESKEDEVQKEAIKDREEQERLEQEQANQNTNVGSSPGSSSTNLKTAAKNIIIGDSRTVGMCALACWAMARAIRASCRSPPLMLLQPRLRRWEMPMRSMAASASSSYCFPGEAKGLSWAVVPMSTISKTLKLNTGVWDCGMYATRWESSAAGMLRISRPQM